LNTAKTYYKDSSGELIKERKENRIEVEKQEEGKGMSQDLSNNSLAKCLGIVETEKLELRNWEGEDLRTEDRLNSRLGRKLKKIKGGKELERKIFLGSKKQREQSRHSPLASKRPEILLNGQGQVVVWARDAPGCPTNFPKSEWSNLFRGNTINLDIVYSSLNTVQPVLHNVAKLGKLEIYDSEIEPAKRVEMAGQWNSAWTETTEVTVFGFPHR
jgi:hypothetical protein